MKIFKLSLIKAFLVSILFSISYYFYNIEIIRANIEDFAFDIINKFYFNHTTTNIKEPKILLFTIDNFYMKEQKLFDEQNNTNYGYLFPRDKIANFIESLDEFYNDIEKENRFKALFIDYDFSFSTLPYGKELSLQDKKLIEVLAKKRDYTILLPVVSSYNFLMHQLKLQQNIKDKKIIFVSVNLKVGDDGIVRRYQAYSDYNNTTYPNISVALFNLVKNKDINITKIKQKFKKEDIVANRIFLKDYKSYSLEDNCPTQTSYWTNLTKYSANCNFYDIAEEDFANSILMLGANHSQSYDKFDTLDILSATNYSGIELHANSINSLLFLNGQLKRVNFIESLLLVFFVTFVISFIISNIFNKFNKLNSKIELIILLAISGGAMFFISIYLLLAKKVWFNPIVPFLLFEAVEILEYIKESLPKLKQKLRRKSWKN